MRDLPTLEQLEYFVALVETGSFRRAAEHCGISQPSLSVQLASAGKAAGPAAGGTRPGGVIPTPAGREVHERARADPRRARTALVNRFDLPRTGLVGIDPLRRVRTRLAPISCRM